MLLLVLLLPHGVQAQNTTEPATILSATEDDYPPFSFTGPDKTASGFSVELLRAALAAMGHKVSFSTGPWSKVKQLLVERKVQVLPLVGRTPEREALFDFTFPYLKMHGTIIVRNDENNIHSPADLKGRSVAVLKGDNAEEFLLRSHIGAKIVAKDSFETALLELAAGEHDAVVIQKLLALQLIQKNNLTNLRSIGRPLNDFVQSFCFAVPKGEAALLQVLNEGLSLVMADRTFDHLYAKWFTNLEAAARKRIVIGGDYDYPPYEFLDEQGLPSGFNVDLSRAIAKKMKLDVAIQLGPWKEIRQSLDEGKIDLVQGMFYSPERNRTLDFSVAHSIIGHVIISRKGEVAPRDINDLAGKKILLLDGDIMHDLAIEKGYAEQLTPVKSLHEGLTLLASGQYDCALMAKIPALYWIEKSGLSNLVVGDKALLAPEYSYASVHGRESLVAGFSEALAALKASGEYRKIYSKWIKVYEPPRIEPLVMAKYSLFIAVPIGLLLIGFIIWNKLLQRQVTQRTAELRHEIFEREQLEEQLRHSEKMQAIGQLAGGVAHDFNNQLASILGYASLLENKLSTEKQRNYLEKIKQAAQRSANLTQQLLAFGRKGKNLDSPTNMSALIMDVVAVLMHSVDKRIKIETHFEALEPIVIGDPTQLQNALLNMALNARDAISGSGTITFKTAVVTLDQDYCSSSPFELQPGSFLKISLIDDGCGFDEETRRRLFEPFFTTKAVGKGTGMGLAGVYGTVVAHKGMIRVSSKLGVGTSFCTYLPLCLDQVAVEGKPADFSPIHGQAHVLVVDDEEEVRSMIAEMLKELGYRVTLMPSGQDAINFYQNFWSQTDLVILDMIMPGLNGQETFAALQRINPQIKAILLSGFSLNEQAQDTLKSGVMEFLGKPFDQGDFSQAVARVLAR